MLAESRLTAAAATPAWVVPALKRIVIAYDGSTAAKRALQDAELLAFRYHAELFLLSIDGALAMAAQSGLPDAADASMQVTAHGIHNRWLHRIGEVQDVVHQVCRDGSADLLMLGAYGHGSQDRMTLGSSAEKLLRTEVCPIFTYGPAVTHPLFAPDRTGPVLFPIALPCLDAQVPRAVELAKLYQVGIQVFHTVSTGYKHEEKWYERECLRVASLFRARGIRTRWNFVYGDPALSICNISHLIKSPFILMPLKRRRELSAATSDNVAARVIRQSTVPVLNYRFD